MMTMFIRAIWCRAKLIKGHNVSPECNGGILGLLDRDEEFVDVHTEADQFCERLDGDE